MNYWKIRAQMTEIKLLEEKANNLIFQIDSMKKQVFAEAGLDLSKNYKMDDAKETIEITEEITK